MSKKFRCLNISIAVIISFISLVIIVTIMFFNSLFPSPISKNKMENEFSDNNGLLISVAKYLEKQEYPSIYITSTHKKGEMYVYYNKNQVGKSIHISNNSISKSISDLFEIHSFEVIAKEANGIYFQRWSNRDNGRGVVYSINGDRPQNDLLIRLEPLNEENWYFYEEK